MKVKDRIRFEPKTRDIFDDNCIFSQAKAEKPVKLKLKVLTKVAEKLEKVFKIFQSQTLLQRTAGSFFILVYISGDFRLSWL